MMLVSMAEREQTRTLWGAKLRRFFEQKETFAIYQKSPEFPYFHLKKITVLINL